MPEELKFSTSGSVLSRVDGSMSTGLKRKGVRTNASSAILLYAKEKID